MTTRISRMFRQNEAGFTLVEMIVALALVGTLAIGAAAGIFHILNANSTNANTVTLTENINSATDYLRDDVLMAQIDATVDPATGIGQTGTEWLVLEWTLPDNGGENHRVAYYFDGNKLFRTHTIDSVSQGSTMIAQSIDPDATYWVLDSDQVIVEITITASLGGYKPSTESRTIQVAPRS